MRGIPRAAVKENVPIKGTKYFAQDIADTTSICAWNHQNYGIDMSKPGAQEFYNSLINQMAGWGVDFIKYDDIVPSPDEVKAVATGKGFNRWCEFTTDQMYTFITLRALSASPLMMGGDLPTLDEFSLKLITHKDILECNQNGVMGSLVYEADSIEIWKSIKKGSEDGWIGIFNRSAEKKSISLRPENF